MKKTIKNILSELNNKFHVKGLKRFAFHVKLIDDKRKTVQEKYWVTWFDTKSKSLEALMWKCSFTLILRYSIKVHVLFLQFLSKPLFRSLKWGFLTLIWNLVLDFLVLKWDFPRNFRTISALFPLFLRIRGLERSFAAFNFFFFF